NLCLLPFRVKLKSVLSISASLLPSFTTTHSLPFITTIQGVNLVVSTASNTLAPLFRETTYSEELPPAITAISGLLIISASNIIFPFFNYRRHVFRKFGIKDHFFTGSRMNEPKGFCMEGLPGEHLETIL